MFYPDGSLIDERVLNIGGSGVVIERDGTAIKLPLIHDASNPSDNIDHEKEVYRRLGNHIGIVPVIDMTGIGIQMVLMRNGSMRDYLSQRTRPTPLIQLYWFLEMASTLAYIHEQRVLVADISTRNFLVASDLTVKFSDFGESSILPPESDMRLVDDYGYTIFTDIGQLGTVMYEIISGRRCEFDLFKDQPPGPATASWPPRDSLPSTSGLWLGSIIESCWTQGFQSAEDFLECLRSAVRDHFLEVRAVQQRLGHSVHIVDYSQMNFRTEELLRLVARSLRLSSSLQDLSHPQKLAMLEGAADTIAHAYSKGDVLGNISVFRFLLEEDGSVKLYDLIPSEVIQLDDLTLNKCRAKDVVAHFGSLIYHVMTGKQVVYDNPITRLATNDVNMIAVEEAQKWETSFLKWSQASRTAKSDEIFLGAIIDKCWALDGFQNMAEVCHALSSIEQEDSSEDRSGVSAATPPSLGSFFSRQLHVSSIVQTALTMTCFSAAIWMFWRSKARTSWM